MVENMSESMLYFVPSQVSQTVYPAVEHKTCRTNMCNDYEVLQYRKYQGYEINIMNITNQ